MTEWINIILEKPPENQYVLCFLKDQSQSVLRREGKFYVPKIDYNKDWFRYNEPSRVTHWMPLPEPPKD